MNNREERREYKRREMILTEYQNRINKIIDNINKKNYKFVTQKTTTDYLTVMTILTNMAWDIGNMTPDSDNFKDFLETQIKRVEAYELQELFPYYDKEQLVVFLEDEKDDR